MKTDSIKKFLLANTREDLAGLYNHNMEVQVNVAEDGGTRVDGDYKGRQWHGWTDGLQTWKSFRIPYKANSDPEYQDREITFDLGAHAEGIGMTGWDWYNRCSRWVAFDFDAIIGHSASHQKKMTDEELEEIKRLVTGIDWVTLRRSTSGKGLHLYVFLDSFPTRNHTEHAAVARAVLGKLSAAVSFDFSAKVDTCGGNMWVWHRKMKDTNGLELLKEGTVLADIPINWQDHVKVVTGQKRRTLPKLISEQPNEVQDLFTELTAQRIRTPLDAEHKRFMGWLDEKYPGCSWWDADHHMLVTHTALLAEAHEDLGMRGVFRTVATGREKGSDHNAYLFPLRKGAWSVRRYTPGIAESSLWQQDGVGWTRCYFNQEPDLVTAARACEGIEDPAGGFEFSNADDAIKAAGLLGIKVDIPNWALTRRTKLKIHKTGQLVVEMAKENNDQGLPGWIAKAKSFHKMFQGRVTMMNNEPEIMAFDETVRHLVTSSGEDRGWAVKTENCWNYEPLEHIKAYLQSQGYSGKEIPSIIGSNIIQCWKIVNHPFEDEFLPNRQWNRNAAQFLVKPTIEQDNLKYDAWLSILNHCGSGLDDTVLQNEWCKENGILKGGDYLKCWVASLFQFPFEPLPYLFLYGEQNSGKSSFHEALSLLISQNGCVRADTALTSQSNFNGELENAVLCIIEETDLRKNTQANNRIKDWVTSRYLNIHKKQRQPYSVLNTCHFVQCNNSQLACPVFPGDTRITMSYVGPLQSLIPRHEFVPMLQAQAADFLSSVLNLEIPKSRDRLRIPCLTGEDKRSAESANRTWLEMFVEEKCHYYPGKMVAFSDFYEKFKEWVDPNYLHHWSKVRVSRELPPPYIKGRNMGDGQTWIGNMSWIPKLEAEMTLPKIVLKDGKLVTG